MPSTRTRTGSRLNSEISLTRRAERELKDFEGQPVYYDELLSRSMVVRGDGFVVHVASVDDIIAAKSFANREKDREALPELLDIQKRERSQGHEEY